MLYWAEGTKSRNTLELVNADPDLISHFCRFLRECFELDDERFRVRISAHRAHELEPASVQRFWIDLLSLPETALIKPVLVPEKARSGRRRLPYGVCSLRVTRGTPVLQHIYGAIQEYGGFERPDWLDMNR